MSTDQTSSNKQLVEAFIQDLFTKGDLGAVDRYLDPGFVNHDPLPGAAEGPEGMREASEVFQRALPDWRSEVERLVAEDDIVVEVFTATGTHSGDELMGVPARGETLTLRGINVFRVRAGKIVERWGRLDDLGLLRQLGLVPGA